VLVRLAGARFAERLEPVFLVAAFFALPRLPLFLFGEEGIFAPDLRASLKPMAMACFGFLTFLPLRPESRSCCLNSCMVSCILPLTIRFDFGSDPDELGRLRDFFEVVFLAAIYAPQTGL